MKQNRQEILKGKKLSEYQKKILHVMSTENNYILESFDVYELKTTYILTNGEDDFEFIKKQTMDKLKSFEFVWDRVLPSCDRIINVKYYIPEKFRHQVFSVCL